MLIEHSKEGREDGAYSRLFGNKELGALISRVHSTSISNGTELERIIGEHAVLLHEDDIPSMFRGTLPSGVYLVTKTTLKNHVTPFLSISRIIEPDFLIVHITNKRIYVIELKDGDNFDTKKASGEVENLQKYTAALNSKLQYPWVAEIKVCFFNQMDKDKIVAGFKGKIIKRQAMTGDDLCKLLGLSYIDIQKSREAEQPRNLKFFVDELMAIPEIHGLVKKKIEQEGD